jgi:hypothetical protein
VEAVLGWDEARLLDALQLALDSHVITPDTEAVESYRVAYALIGEVLYGQLVARRRKQLHQRIGATLEAQLSVGSNTARHAELTHQFAAAEDWPRAVRYAISAGDWSRKRYATHTALRFYTVALDAARRLEHLPTSDLDTVDGRPDRPPCEGWRWASAWTPRRVQRSWLGQCPRPAPVLQKQQAHGRCLSHLAASWDVGRSWPRSGARFNARACSP